eukprot:152995-Amphidinium_carterae.1
MAAMLVQCVIRELDIIKSIRRRCRRQKMACRAILRLQCQGRVGLCAQQRLSRGTPLIRHFNAEASKDAGSSGGSAEKESESDRRHAETGEYDTQDESKRVGNPIMWANPTGMLLQRPVLDSMSKPDASPLARESRGESQLSVQLLMLDPVFCATR